MVSGVGVQSLKNIDACVGWNVDFMNPSSICLVFRQENYANDA